MIPTDFFVEVADYQTDLAALRQVREPVFVQEQKVPIEEEWDELDPLSRHVIARDLQGQPIGTARLTPQHKIGRMAVLSDWRSRGVGAAMLQALMDLARSLGYREISLNSQVDAIGFYQRFGFESLGEDFIEAGIRHRVMRKQLEPAGTVQRAGPRPVPENRDIEIATHAEARAATLDLLSDAQRQVWIYTRDLEAALYGDPAVLEQLKRVGTQGRSAEIRILLIEPASVIKQTHALLPLAQRLASTFQIRSPGEEIDRQNPSAFLLNDCGGFINRPIGSRWEGIANRHGPGPHRQLLDYFKQVWERALPCSELRALNI
jgi:predicted GNAT family N-acyltransferase